MDEKCRSCELLYRPFSSQDTLPMLYEAWHRLPTCELMAVIGAAIQDIQAMRDRLAVREG